MLNASARRCKQLMQGMIDALVSIHFTICSLGSVVRSFDLKGH